MKIQRFNESNPFDDKSNFDAGIKIKIHFYGDEEISLGHLKDMGYYNVNDPTNIEEINNAIRDGVLDFIIQNGFGDHKIGIVDQNNNPVNLEMYINADKFNL